MPGWKSAGVVGQEVVVYHIHKSAAVEPVSRLKNCFGFAGGCMRIGKGIDGAVQHNAFLHGARIIQFFTAFHIITDHIAQENFRVIEREVCVSEVIQDYFLFACIKVTIPVISSCITGKDGSL